MCTASGTGTWHLFGLGRSRRHEKNKPHRIKLDEDRSLVETHGRWRMRRKGRANFKVQRRLNTELPGMGKSGALERRPYPPGEHGQKRRKFSDYRLQLDEKQKLLNHFALREEQLRRFIRQAKSGSAEGDWVERLASLLERRLDNVIFRLGFAASMRAARQLISHGHVFVNGKRVTIASRVIEPGEIIALDSESLRNEKVLESLQHPRLELPHFLSREDQNGMVAGRVVDEPHIGDIPFPFSAKQFAEYYSR